MMFDAHSTFHSDEPDQMSLKSRLIQSNVNFRTILPDEDAHFNWRQCVRESIQKNPFHKYFNSFMIFGIYEIRTNSV